jgi:integrase
MKYRFYLDRQKDDGSKRITLRVSLAGKTFWLKSDRYTYADMWSQTMQRSKDGPTQALIDVIRAVMSDVEKTCYLSGVPITKPIIQAKWKQVFQKNVDVVVKKDTQYTFFESFDIYYNKYQGQKEYNYLRKFRSACKHIDQYDPSLTWSSINKSFIDPYINYCVNSEKPLLNSSINKYLSCLREVCRMAMDDGIPLSRDFESFKLKQQKPKPVWLTREEAAALLSVEIKSETEQKVLDDSACRYYLALRHSDSNQLSKHHFSEIDGQVYIQIYLIKTRTDLSLAVPRQAIDILKKYDYTLPRVSLQEKNRAIKVLAKRAGINAPVEIVRFSGSRRIVKVVPKWKVISTHTFRRSFGRRFMESVGDISKLSDIFCHTDTKTTEGYIGWESKELADAMNKVVF